MAFWPAKVLLSAVELGLFTELGAACDDRQRAAGRARAPRARQPGFLRHAGRAAFPRTRRRRRRAPATATRPRPRRSSTAAARSYIGGILEMANARLYRFWGDLTEALRTGQPQNEIKHDRQVDVRGALQRAGTARTVHRRDDRHLGRQLRGLRRRSSTSRRYKTLCDVGGATGLLSLLVAKRAPAHALHLGRPAAGDADRRAEDRRGRRSADRVTAAAARLLRRPAAQGRRHHDGHDPPRLEPREEDAPDPGGLRRPAAGGAFVVIENLIDDARRENAFGLLMSLNMLIEFGDALRLHRRRLHRLVPRGRLQRSSRSSHLAARRAPASPTSSPLKKKGGSGTYVRGRLADQAGLKGPALQIYATSPNAIASAAVCTFAIPGSTAIASVLHLDVEVRAVLPLRADRQLDVLVDEALQEARAEGHAVALQHHQLPAPRRSIVIVLPALASVCVTCCR